MISYTDEFFSNDDTLTGYLSTYSVTFCMNGKQAVPISVLSGGNHLILNSFIISNGLAIPQVISDKKWAKDRRLIRRFWISINPEKAKQQGLYLYGGNTHPHIEMIVNANRQ